MCKFDHYAFQSPCLLIAYQDDHGLHSVFRVISRWAPANENDAMAYVKAVSAEAGSSPDQKLDLHGYADLKPLVAAIIRHENGQQPYTDAQIDKALVLAGVEPPGQSLQKTRTVKGGQAATAATVGLGALQAVQDSIAPATESLQTLAPYLDIAKWLLLAVTLIGIAVMLWARIDDRRRGLR